MKLYKVVAVGSALYNIPMTNANLLDYLFGPASSPRSRTLRQASGKAVYTSCSIEELKSTYPVQYGEWVCKGLACSVACYDPADPTVKVKTMNKMAKCNVVNGQHTWTSFAASKPELDEISCTEKHKKSKYVPTTPTPTEPPVVTDPPTPEPVVVEPESPDTPITQAPIPLDPASPVDVDPASPVDPVVPSDLVDPSKPHYTKPKYTGVRTEYNYDKSGALMCEMNLLRDIDNSEWVCKGRGAKVYCTLMCDNPNQNDVNAKPIKHPKLVKCVEGEWVPSSEGVVQIDHITCDGRSNKVPKKPQNDGEALCNYVPKPEPAEHGSWVCDKKGSKCFLKCYNGYDPTRKTMMLCKTENGQKNWVITKGTNGCYNPKNCASESVPNESSYYPGVFTCNAGKSCNFQCGAVKVQTARKCKNGQWINTTGQKKGRSTPPADVACCSNAAKPSAPQYGDYETSCRNGKFGDDVCVLNCSNGAVLNKRLKARVTCVGNQWVLSGHASCDQIEINAFVKEHKKNNMNRSENSSYYYDSDYEYGDEDYY